MGDKFILFVDDSDLFRELMCDCLKANGFEVCGCPSANEALAAAEKAEFHVIITDYRMPNMNGIEAARLLRGRFPSAFIMGISWDDVGKYFIAAGADAFLQKPFEYEDLMKLLNGNLSNLGAYPSSGR